MKPREEQPRAGLSCLSRSERAGGELRCASGPQAYACAAREQATLAPDRARTWERPAMMAGYLGSLDGALCVPRKTEANTWRTVSPRARLFIPPREPAWRHLSWQREEGPLVLAVPRAARAPVVAAPAAPVPRRLLPRPRPPPRRPPVRRRPRRACAARARRRRRRRSAVEARDASTRSAASWATAGAASCARAARTSSSASGNPRAELVFVGEGPGADEDLQGVPFVGAAGELLTKMIEAMGFTPRRRLHLQRREVPAAGQPQPGAGRDRRVRAVPARAARGHPAQGHRGAGKVRGADAAARHHAHHPACAATGANTRASS